MTLEIYNVLVQVVAVPELQTGGRERVRGLRLRCGSYVAYWSGRYLDDEREVTPGVYYYRIVVNDGQSIVVSTVTLSILSYKYTVGRESLVEATLTQG